MHSNRLLLQSDRDKKKNMEIYGSAHISTSVLLSLLWKARNVVR